MSTVVLNGIKHEKYRLACVRIIGQHKKWSRLTSCNKEQVSTKTTFPVVRRHILILPYNCIDWNVTNNNNWRKYNKMLNQKYMLGWTSLWEKVSFQEKKINTVYCTFSFYIMQIPLIKCGKISSEIMRRHPYFVTDKYWVCISSAPPFTTLSLMGLL